MSISEGSPDIVEAAYAAVTDEGRWSAVLGGLVGLVGGVSGVMLSIDGKTGAARMLASANMDPHYQDVYAAHYRERDPWSPGVLGRPVGVVVPSEDRLPHEDLIRTEFYNEWLRPQGIEGSLGCVLLREHGEMLVLGLPRGAKTGPYEPRQLDRLRAVVPHLQRALQLDWQLAHSGVEGRVALGLLDSLTEAVFLVDHALRAVPVNAAAAALARAGDGVTWRRSALQVPRPSDQRALDRAIGEAVGALDGDGPGAGGVLSLPRPSGRPAYSVLVSPLPREPGGLLRGRACAAVIITDPARRDDAAVPPRLN